ncbi:hypothetical protein INR49_021867 [Caranx melampygus]|nr:hypothetical protein INR49_021867 [Caranx melampygus]
MVQFRRSLCDVCMAADVAAGPAVPWSHHQGQQRTMNQTPELKQEVSSACAQPLPSSCLSSPGGGSALQVHAVRFGPGQELLSSLQSFVEERRLRAPFIITCVGSVTKATLRLAKATAEDTNHVMNLSGRFEIVSLVGTLGPRPHLHISLSDAEGQTVGGHVLGDLEIFTTAEVVVGEALDLQFTREMDQSTGFPELVIGRRSQTDESPDT